MKHTNATRNTIVGTLIAAKDGSFIFFGQLKLDGKQKLRIEYDASRHTYDVVTLAPAGWSEHHLAVGQSGDLRHQAVTMSRVVCDANAVVTGATSRIVSNKRSLASRTSIDDVGRRDWIVEERFEDGTLVKATGSGQASCEVSTQKISKDGKPVWTRETKVERTAHPGAQVVASTARTKYASGAEVVEDIKTVITAVERTSKGAVRVITEGKAIDANGIDITGKLPVKISDHEKIDAILGEWTRDGTRTYADGSSRSIKGKGRSTAAGLVETIVSNFSDGGDSGTSSSLVERQFHRPGGASWVSEYEPGGNNPTPKGHISLYESDATDVNYLDVVVSWNFSDSSNKSIKGEVYSGDTIYTVTITDDSIDFEALPWEKIRPSDDGGGGGEGGGDEGPGFAPITTKAEINLHLGRHKAEDEEREGSRYGVDIGAWLRANAETTIPLGGADGDGTDLNDAGPDLAESLRSTGIQISVGGADSDGWGLETNPRAFVTLSEQLLVQAIVQSRTAMRGIATAIRANQRTGKRIDATMTRAGIDAMPKLSE